MNEPNIGDVSIGYNDIDEVDLNDSYLKNAPVSFNKHSVKKVEYLKDIVKTTDENNNVVISFLTNKQKHAIEKAKKDKEVKKIKRKIVKESRKRNRK